MTIQEAIEKANENGYRSDALAIVKNTFVVFDEDGEEEIEEFAQVFMDPLFWQSLGKALGWKSDGGSYHDEIAWQEYWHRFIDHLTEGKDAESFFETLIK